MSKGDGSITGNGLLASYDHLCRTLAFNFSPCQTQKYLKTLISGPGTIVIRSTDYKMGMVLYS